MRIETLSSSRRRRITMTTRCTLQPYGDGVHLTLRANCCDLTVLFRLGVGEQMTFGSDHDFWYVVDFTVGGINHLT